MTISMPWLLRWMLGIGLLMWVIHSPAHAGYAAAHLVHTVVTWAEHGATALTTFVQAVT